MAFSGPDIGPVGQMKSLGYQFIKESFEAINFWIVQLIKGFIPLDF
jgi:hypothetical protein